MVRYDDKTLMPFGKHQGTALANVPAAYLLWCYENIALSPPMKEYIKDNFGALKAEVKRSGKFNSR